MRSTQRSFRPTWEVPERREGNAERCSVAAHREGTSGNSVSSRHVQLLRRPYARTMTEDIRSFDILLESLTDLAAQWKQKKAVFVDAYESSDSVPLVSQKGVSTFRSALNPLVSQAKAIKQELVWHWNKHQNRAAERPPTEEPSHDVSSALFFSQLVVEGKREKDRLVAAGEVVGIETREEVAFQCAWAWALFLAVLTDDMELLTTTLSFAVAELIGSTTTTTLNSNSSSSSINTTKKESRVLLDAMSLLKSETVEPLFIAEAHSAKITDIDVFLACELLYAIATADDIAASTSWARCLRRSLTSSDAQERALFWNAIFSLSTSFVAEEFEVLSPPSSRPYSEFWSRAHPLMKSSGDAMCVLCSLCPFVVLFCGVLSMHVVRRQLVGNSYGNAWRPVIDPQNPTSSNESTADAPKDSELRVEASDPGALLDEKARENGKCVSLFYDVLRYSWVLLSRGAAPRQGGGTSTAGSHKDPSSSRVDDPFGDDATCIAALWPFPLPLAKRLLCVRPLSNTQ